MSYSTQNLGSLMDDLGSQESAGGTKGARRAESEGQAFWKSQGFVISLAVVAFAVLVGGVWYSFFTGGPPRPPGSVTLLDVKTGEMFVTSTKRLALPAKNPNTGERSLFPIFKNDNGEWTLTEHYHAGVEETGYSQDVIPNLSSGRLNINDSNVEKLNR